MLFGFGTIEYMDAKQKKKKKKATTNGKNKVYIVSYLIYKTPN